MQSCSPPALPVLQAPALVEGVPRTSMLRSDGAFFDCTFCSDVAVARAEFTMTLLMEESTDTLQTLGAQLLGFFAYYANFDFEHRAVSIRTGLAIPKHEGTWAHRAPGSSSFSIEDPFEISHDLGAHLTPEAFAITRAELLRAHILLAGRSGRVFSVHRDGCVGDGRGDAMSEQPPPEVGGVTGRWADIFDELFITRPTQAQDPGRWHRATAKRCNLH